MPGALTGGFDAAAQISDDFINAILAGLYKMGRIPSLQTLSVPLNNQSYSLDLYIQQPTLIFNNVLPVVLTLTVPFVLRTSAIPGEASGTFALDFSPSLQRSNGIARLVIDLSQVVPGNLITWDAAPPLVDELTAIVDQAISNVLANQVVTIPLGPTSTPLLPQADMRLYSGVSEIAQLDAVPIGEPNPIAVDNNFLGVFADRSRNVVAPDTFVSQLSRYNGSTPADWSFQHNSWKPDYAVMVSNEIVDAALANGIAALQLPLVIGDSLTLNTDLAIERDTNYGLLRITGSATQGIHIFNDPAPIVSPTASFEIYVALDIVVNTSTNASGSPVYTSRLEVTTTKVTINLPTWITVALTLITGVFTKDILEAISTTIAEKTGNLGMSFPVPMLKTVAESIEFSDLPDPNAPLNLALVNNGAIAFSADGALTWGNLLLTVPEVLISTPTYFWGNKNTGEFHNDACPYGQKVKRKERFVTAEDAMAAGFDGCHWCLPQYQAIAPGEFQVVVYHPDQPGFSYKGILLSFAWTQLSAGSSTGSADPGSQQTIKGGLLITGLQSGKWQIDVQADNWQTTTSIDVEADTRTMVAFTYGSDTVQASYTDAVPHLAG